MKITITRHGTLVIWRAGEEKEMHCIHRHAHLCCDVCPHFGEPTSALDCHDQPTEMQYLELCHGKIIEGEITDERAAPRSQG